MTIFKAAPVAPSFLVSDRIKKLVTDEAFAAYRDYYARIPNDITVNVKLSWRARMRALFTGRLFVKVHLHDQ
jgi:hypothetical protein